jgi:hypothetical protein
MQDASIRNITFVEWLGLIAKIPWFRLVEILHPSELE